MSNCLKKDEREKEARRIFNLLNLENPEIMELINRYAFESKKTLKQSEIFEATKNLVPINPIAVVECLQEEINDLAETLAFYFVIACYLHHKLEKATCPEPPQKARHLKLVKSH